MNPQTKLRLAKEARALLPFWAAIAGLMVVPFLMHSNSPVEFSVFAYVFGCALLGTVCIGHEFNHRTMGLLLSQPVSRRRLWWEKMSVLCAGLLILMLILMSLALWESSFFQHVLSKTFARQIEENSSFSGALFGFLFSHGMSSAQWIRVLVAHLVLGTHLGDTSGFTWNTVPWTPWLYRALLVFVLPPLVAFCTGPVLTMLARGTIGGVALTFMCPWALSLPLWFILPDDQSFKSGQFTTGEVWALFLSLFVAPCLYMSWLFLLGCRRFQRFEDANTLAQDISLPVQLTQPFARFTGCLTLGRGSALGNLIRKELRLQQPAFIIAAILMLLWTAMLVAVMTHATHPKEFLYLSPVMLCLAIPVIAGVVSTAEERNLSVHEWHLTLPISARRQWFVKVFVSLGVNALLGVLLPWALAQCALIITHDKLVLTQARNDFIPFLIANIVAFCAALYASSASSNSLRALVGTIVIFIAVPVVLFPLGGATHRFLSFVAYSGRYLPSVSQQTWQILYWLSQILWSIGWVGAVGGLYCLGMANFRRSLDSVWRPVRQAIFLFAGIYFYIVGAAVLYALVRIVLVYFGLT